VPLAPYEMFHPWWGRSYYGRGGYFNQQINITNVNITNIYRNSNFANGVHGMRVSDFESGHFGNNIGRYNGRQIGEVGAVRGGMPLAPGNEHLRFSDRGLAGTPRTSSANTRFFSQQPASKVERISFAQQQRAFAQQGGPANRTQGAAPGQAGQRAIERQPASGPARAMERSAPDTGARGNAPRRPEERPSGRRLRLAEVRDAGKCSVGRAGQCPAGRATHPKCAADARLEPLRQPGAGRCSEQFDPTVELAAATTG